MKVTANQLTDLLRNMGVSVELVADESASEYNADTVLQAVDTNREPIIKQKLESDLTNAITTKITGMVGGKLKQTLRDKTGIAMSELKDLKDDEAIAKAMEHYNATFSKDTEGLRTQLTEQAANTEKAMQELRDAHTQELSGWKSKYNDRYVSDYFTTLLEKAPFPETADRATLAGIYKSAMQNQYDFTYDDATGKVLVLQKGSQNMALNEKGTSPVDVSAGAKEFFSKMGVWQEDLRDKSAGGITNDRGTGFKPATAAGAQGAQGKRSFAEALGK